MSASPPSLASFEKRAQAGEPLKVIFLGGSMTWGANASDPERTSWRGLMMRYLLGKYPKTQFTFFDASIGGTGSALALFRIDRDVLARKPDLVFLDFTVNDEAEGHDEQTLASYERVLRDLLSSGTAVFPVLMSFRHHVSDPDAAVPPRHQAHLRLAAAYGLPVANTLDPIRHRIRNKTTDVDCLWIFPKDGAHPGDAGYAVFFEVVRDAYEEAILSGMVPGILKATVFSDLYPKRNRRILSAGNLAEGWTRRPTYRTSMWFDGLSSRWMDEVVATKSINGNRPQSVEVTFRGSMVGLFGERDAISLPFRAWIDGKPVLPADAKQGSGDLWQVDTTRFHSATAGAGQLFLWILLKNDLPEGEHLLRIEPDCANSSTNAELRIESVCSAGR